MRKVFGISFLTGIFMITGLGRGWAAASEAQTYDWQDKLKRGALNIVTSPVEIAREIHVTSEEKNLLVGWTFGLAKGLGNGVLRFGAGVVDLFTFPFGFPDSDMAPLIDPEYVWQKEGPKYI